MQTFTIEISIPEELRLRFEARLKAHGGDTQQYVKEAIAKDLFAMSDPTRQSLIDETFEKNRSKVWGGAKKPCQVIQFLTLEDVKRLHDLSIARHGGIYGVRDEGLLQSAIQMP
jgi:hypothetical protein